MGRSQLQACETFLIYRRCRPRTGARRLQRVIEMGSRNLIVAFRLFFACPKSPSRPRVLSPPNLKSRRSPTRSPTKTRSSRHREIRRKTGRCATRSSRMRTGHVPEGGGPAPAAGLSRQSVFSPGNDPKGSIDQGVPMGCKIVRWVKFRHAQRVVRRDPVERRPYRPCLPRPDGAS